MERNLTMLIDFYELTMANSYYKKGLKDTEVVFDVFYRTNPDHGGYVIYCGLQQIIEYVKGLHFNNADIEYLREKKIFDEDFLSYLKEFKFTGDIYSCEEGLPIFPKDVVIKVKAKLIEAQLLETMLLIIFNHQSLIATKASRIAQAARGKLVMEFGARRAQGYDGAVIGARAAYIGGAHATATCLSDQLYGVPAIGTMAHSFVQLFPTEYEAFAAYASTYPNDTTLLIDTYDVIKSGIVNAIRVHKEILEPQGSYLKGVRIDSGDLAYLTKKVRKILDEAGLTQTKICVSNSLDEYTITSLLDQHAPIDSFGVGERLITAKSDSVLGGVYKLAAVKTENGYEPKIKLSETNEKITNPGDKKVIRFFDKDTNKALGDCIMLNDEVIDDSKPFYMFDEYSPYKSCKFQNYRYEELLKPIFINGKQVYKEKTTQEIRAFSLAQKETLWDEVLRFENPHTYYVDISNKLFDIKKELIFTFKAKEL